MNNPIYFFQKIVNFFMKKIFEHQKIKEMQEFITILANDSNKIKQLQEIMDMPNMGNNLMKKLGNSKEDAEKFTKQTAVLVEQYDNFKMLDSLHVDGKLTLGENIADVGGLTVSLNALKSVLAKSGDTTKIDGFTPLQRFFLSYSQVWSQSIRDKELMRRLKEDVHSPGNARVNGAIVNIPEFYDAFSVKESDPMFLKEEKRAKIW